MGCLIQEVDQQVIHVNYQSTLCDVNSEEIIHKGLEYGWGVTHSEEHDIGFEQPKWGGEGSLPTVLWFDEDVIISPLYIEFGEDQWSSEFIDKIRDKEEEIGILDCMAVEVPVVSVGS